MNTLALGYPILGPSHHVPAYYYMPSSSPDYLCSDPFHHDTFRPLLRLAPFPLVIGCSRPLVGVDTESSKVVQETPHPLFFLAPNAARAPHQFSEHHAFRQPRVLRARRKSREQDPPPAYNHLDVLTSRPHKRAQIGNRAAGTIAVSPNNAASQEAVVGSAKRVVVVRARAPRDAAVQHCLE